MYICICIYTCICVHRLRCDQEDEDKTPPHTQAKFSTAPSHTADMDDLAQKMQEMADGMKAMALAQKYTQEKVKELSDRQERLESAVAQASQASFHGVREPSPKRTRMALEFSQPQAETTEEEPKEGMQKHITRGETVDLIHQVLTTVVAPQVQELVNRVDARVSIIEGDVHRLKLRLAWVERDVMVLQTDVAKRQIVLRSWPKNSTEKTRWATVEKLLDEAGVWKSTVVLTTPVYQADPPEYPEDRLSPISILTVQSFEDRQKIFKTSGKFSKYVSKPGEDPEDDATQIKLIPGITQMERRLEAPLQHMMNAFTAAFKAYKGVSFKPQWKTLTLTDDRESWMGRVKYVRQGASFSTVSPQSNWKCMVQLPEELAERVIASWKNTWTEQLAKQVHLTDAEDKAAEGLSTEQKAHWTRALTKPRPQWNEGADLGVQEWKARYAWEFPWEIEFETLPKDHPEREAYAKLRTVEELMMEMTADATMAQAEEEGNDAWAHYRKASTAPTAAAEASTGSAGSGHVSQ